MLLKSCKIFLNVRTGMSYLLEAPLFDIPSCCNALWALVRASSVHLPRRSLHFWLVAHHDNTKPKKKMVSIMLDFHASSA